MTATAATTTTTTTTKQSKGKPQPPLAAPRDDGEDAPRIERHFGVDVDMRRVTMTDTGPSITSMVPLLPKYVLEIHKSDDKSEVDPVFVCNGDYQCTVRRGRRVVVSVVIVDALRRAVSGRVDPVTLDVSNVPSYPFTAAPYDGDLPIGAEIVDE